MCCSDHNAVGGTELYPPLPEHIEALARSIEEGGAPADLYSALLESQCGTTDDSQPVEQYDGTLGVTTAFVDSYQPAVGQLQWQANLGAIYTNPGNVSGVRWCSGTLIGRNLFLTAGHCLDPVNDSAGFRVPRDNTTGNLIQPAEIATRMRVNFNFQVDASGNPRAEQSFNVQALVEHRLGTLDFAVLQLNGDPQAVFGRNVVACADASVGDTLAIIGHPAGVRKRIEAGSLTAFVGSSLTYDDIDTLGGNSGSGVLLSPEGEILGVHTNGGCTSGGGANSGVRTGSLLGASPTLVDIALRPWISALYADVLGRAPDAAGLQFWLDQLGSGQSLRSVANGFLSSQEYCTRVITDLYQQLLSRAPDASGLAFWVSSMQGGTSFQQIVLGFCDSAEYLSNNPPPDQFVESLYERLLGRASDTAGKQGWIAALQAGGSTADVIDGFLRSQEYCTNEVTSLYLTLLGRSPDSAGLAGWVASMSGGESLQEIQIGFLTSVEYQASGANRF